MHDLYLACWDSSILLMSVMAIETIGKIDLRERLHSCAAEMNPAGIGTLQTLTETNTVSLRERFCGCEIDKSVPLN